MVSSLGVDLGVATVVPVVVALVDSDVVPCVAPWSEELPPHPIAKPTTVNMTESTKIRTQANTFRTKPPLIPKPLH